VTYGFLHSVDDIKHILFNLLALWMFGRPVEERYGRREYLAIFLAAVAVGGLAWVLGELAANRGMAPLPPMLGASGGISAIVILFALNYPHQTVLFMFLFPMPMWVLAILLVGIDVVGAIDRSGTVACTAHLGGAAFGFLYYRWGLRLERWLPNQSWFKGLRRRPKLRVVDPDAADRDTTDARVDEILKKIQQYGQDSLTRGERRILEQASREYQKRKR
jgi:membrane associated rhomboid family serine protease